MGLRRRTAAVSRLGTAASALLASAGAAVAAATLSTTAGAEALPTPPQQPRGRSPRS